MNLKEFRKFCLSFDGVSEDYPFDDDILAFKVIDKIFALADAEKFDGITLKCDPVKAAMLRGLYKEVKPGRHIEDKRHWNMIAPEGELDDELIKEWIKDSYGLVVDDLSRKKQKKLEKMDDD